MSNIALLKQIWELVYAPEKDVRTVITHYFHPHYTQCINGVEMNFDDYIPHVKEQKQNMKIIKIDYKHIVGDGNEVFALYYPKGTNNEGLLVEAEVIAYFKFEEQKLKRIHGQVRLIEGSFSDVDM
jgi:hypothetical protein